MRHSPLLIAKVPAQQPSILLLDEIASCLDLKGSMAIIVRTLRTKDDNVIACRIIETQPQPSGK